MKKYILGNLSLIPFLLMGCGEYNKPERPAYTLTETIYVDRLPDDNYRLTQRIAGNWEVYTGTDSHGIQWDSPYRFSDGDTIFIENPNADHRLYFATVNAKDTLYLSEREIDMEKAVNFRDLGGMPTVDGKHTKWGMMFRSGELAELTEEDLNYMSELGIQTIADLRSDQEIEEKPDVYPNGVRWVHLPIGNMGNTNTQDAFKQLKEADPETFDGDALMEEVSVEFIHSTENYKKLFDILLSGKETPVLFHCTAGKDRTGYTAAIILATLGVDRKTIVQDYELSNYFRHDANEEMVEKAAKFYGLDQRILRPIMGVKAPWLEKGFEKIDKEYGSFQNYLEQGIGIDSVDQMRLRKKFLE